MQSLVIRKSTESDIQKLGAFYDDVVHHLVQTGSNYPKWRYQDYPSEKSVRKMTSEGSQYICLLDGVICASFVMNDNPNGDYEKGAWQLSLKRGEYAVIHALAVSPSFFGRGIGSAVCRYCIDIARKMHYKAVRIDVVPTNIPAIRLYRKMGFAEMGTVDLGRNNPDIPFFTLMEYVL